MRLSIYFISFYYLILFSSCTTDLEKNNPMPFFHSFDQTKIAFTDQGKGEVVILIHGFISNGSSWNKTVLKKS